ncbi:ADP-dependent NAD(P)H-hydrate dehydratase [Gryllotalpicola ginsengisoli]|uniref:ADP-dependent NAD(P)H-hydrate dehydratase n=1 Tax=Gryllotalpicola ginsengisoli TaxID=444608 RepID=UPI0003B66098|nr:ADP/ATP-dependent (S)-NAD(P)H-hydrate dehydratase [Gryllotalpicola ginsengisoli]
MTAEREWTEDDLARILRAPGPDDDKYTRGVLGVATGSQRYPGAAVLGVEAAVRTGVGMVRYLGPEAPSRLVLQRRPEIVTGAGRVQAWLVGSGMPAASERDHDDELRVLTAMRAGVPVVADAGALDRVADAKGPVVVTPHYRELERALADSRAPLSLDEIRSDAASAAARAADALGVTVLLKGSRTHIASPGGEPIVVSLGTPWLATAGSGDVLGGVLGALVAGHSSWVEARGHAALAELAASAAALHGLAGRRASAGGPIVALDIAAALPATVAELLAARR